MSDDDTSDDGTGDDRLRAYRAKRDFRRTRRTVEELTREASAGERG